MPSSLSDTRPEAEAIQMALLRRATPARRLSLAFSLSESVCALSRRAIRRANPRLTDREVGLLFVSLSYGEELAQAVRAELARRP
jgi:hypothetical protein